MFGRPVDTLFYITRGDCEDDANSLGRLIDKNVRVVVGDLNGSVHGGGIVQWGGFT